MFVDATRLRVNLNKTYIIYFLIIIASDVHVTLCSVQTEKTEVFWTMINYGGAGVGLLEN